MDTQRIEIGGADVDVEILDQTRTRKVGRRIVESLPVILADWPISVADIARRANEVFAAANCRADRADRVWATNKAGLDFLVETTERYYFRAVPTREEAAALNRAARDEARDGLTAEG